ncbi:ABC transporter ATP-binding protein [Desulfitobacterium hafniense]|uniref:ABC transporter ATP-binding protein n=1 Tax=Desulfitobacterium hafniense TaxID=49338 RepID=UPI000360E314|nr:ABC transporter ATP-binding protein [Desulfitobacterium hafniense]
MLQLHEISKSFGTLPVLNKVSFTVEDGEIVALIGPSGCGKSTLLNIIAGIQKPDEGALSGGSDAMAYVFQDDRLLPWRTVWDNIRLVRDKENRPVIQELIDTVGLRGFETYYPAQLSGGMKKRCGIARSFYYESHLLLMDEPFQGLDYCLRREMLHLLLKVWQKHKQGVLFITHEIDDALTIASRIIVLSPRPGEISKEFRLPGQEGRDPGSPELTDTRREIIAAIAN